ncbi:hypothetical protein BLNAU_10681 [Blattamonas nauphoetae]|uniref:Uncharacterized protein n=1 Tax=Blattamonas nauphoetae TaxID=2049346 RepID=A0ABQ9XR91_9EUKA|nr:hypothetical protein BLNAU_10681 [Blattamonas nauphoetae]
MVGHCRERLPTKTKKEKKQTKKLNELQTISKRERVREGKRKRFEEEMMTRQKDGGGRADGEEQVAVGEQIPG